MSLNKTLLQRHLLGRVYDDFFYDELDVLNNRPVFQPVASIAARCR